MWATLLPNGEHFQSTPKLVVHDIPSNIQTVAQIEHMFGPHPGIINVRIDPTPGQSPVVAIIRFRTRANLRKAVTRINNTYSPFIQLSRIPRGMSEEDIRMWFMHGGEIKDIKMSGDKEFKENDATRKCIVIFRMEQDARRAIDQLCDVVGLRSLPFQITGIVTHTQYELPPLKVYDLAKELNLYFQIIWPPNTGLFIKNPEEALATIPPHVPGPAPAPAPVPVPAPAQGIQQPPQLGIYQLPPPLQQQQMQQQGNQPQHAVQPGYYPQQMFPSATPYSVPQSYPAQQGIQQPPMPLTQQALQTNQYLRHMLQAIETQLHNTHIRQQQQQQQPQVYQQTPQQTTYQMLPPAPPGGTNLQQQYVGAFQPQPPLMPGGQYQGHLLPTATVQQGEVRKLVLYVPPEYTSDHLMTAFAERYGGVLSASVHQMAGNSLGVGEIVFSRQDYADDALTDTNPMKVFVYIYDTAKLVYKRVTCPHHLKLDDIDRDIRTVNMVAGVARPPDCDCADLTDPTTLVKPGYDETQVQASGAAYAPE